jgi:hypothetical protein
VSEEKETGSGSSVLSRIATRRYVLIAAVLVVVIVVAAILLITKGIPALREEEEPTAVTDVGATATQMPTFTPGPTKEPTNTPLPSPTPTRPPFVMTDDYEVVFEAKTLEARPSTEWTGFFGQVLDAEGVPLADVPLIVLYPDLTPVELANVPTSPVVMTNEEGSYEIRLADGPHKDTWSILVLADDRRPASDILTFATDEDTDKGTQQIRIVWQQLP